MFSVDGAKEKNADATKNASAEGDEAEGLFAIGSVFAEITLDDKFVIGVDYVPHTLESNQVSNQQKEGSSTVNNTAEVHVDEVTTVYAAYYVNDNFYGKIGVLQADVLTREVLGTGGAYPNAEIDGVVFGVGYERDLNSGLFVRLEGSYMDLDGVRVINSNDSTKSVSVDGAMKIACLSAVAEFATGLTTLSTAGGGARIDVLELLVSGVAAGCPNIMVSRGDCIALCFLYF